MVPSQLKLGMSIATIELYADIPLFVTFDFYVGHKVSICLGGGGGQDGVEVVWGLFLFNPIPCRNGNDRIE